MIVFMAQVHFWDCDACMPLRAPERATGVESRTRRIGLRPLVTRVSTGAGKSTITRLLLRFHDPRAGQVLIDGTDIRDLDLRSLRVAIGYVSQDVFLFQGTVRENLAFGRPGATDVEIETRRDSPKPPTSSPP
jgi:ABC-type transport system involved in Fe-S cluster assembly fused permease/ATPase subunit